MSRSQSPAPESAAIARAREGVALEASPKAGRVRHVRMVRQEHTPDPVTVVDPCDPGPAVRMVRERIVRTKRAGAGSYLFIDDTMRAFVLSELQSIAPTWLREHFGWLVAYYAPRRRDGSRVNDDGTPFLTATSEGIAEDIEQHLIDLGAARA